jgi:hypothetical protein
MILLIEQQKKTPVSRKNKQTNKNMRERECVCTIHNKEDTNKNNKIAKKYDDDDDDDDE